MVWVRVFGNVFGNTLASASLIVAVFMLGLGVGSYLGGVWADRHYLRGSRALVRLYAAVEVTIGLSGLIVSAVLPHLGDVAAAVSAYVRRDSWYVLSTSSHLARAGIAVALLAPITILMGATLTLLVRALVGRDLERGRRRIAALYAVNTLGAAVGAALTDFGLVPAVGLGATQAVAAGLNGLAAAGALALTRRARWTADTLAAPALAREGPLPSSTGRRPVAPEQVQPVGLGESRPRLALAVGLALALSGFAGMGIEVVWFRHLSILLGQFRAVFALLLTVILAGIAAGSVLAGGLERRRLNPVSSWAVLQGLFVLGVLGGLLTADGRAIDEAVRVEGRGVLAGAEASSVWRRLWGDFAFNLGPIVAEVGLAALLMGFGYPLGNVVVQRAEAHVGRRAGVLYLANTAGAVAGAALTGFALLPGLGLQGTAGLLAALGASAIVPLAWLWRADGRAGRPQGGGWFFASAVASAAALVGWMLLPPTLLLDRALGRAESRGQRLVLDEAVTEIVEVTETRDGVRWLLTNGHPMSSTAPLAQRYMRALAHVPLLCLERPESVLVIGFGVGNTVHAAALHPTVRRIEVAELSEAILVQADRFGNANGGVLRDPRVTVYVNDGRHHLRMRPPASFDLITLEPPPVAYAGVAALYSREFYELVRERLAPGGYLSQWLPAYQVPAESALALIRAFIEVFPQAVLLSGAEADLLLLGVKDRRIEIDPVRVAERLAAAPAVQADLARVDLGQVHEIVGMFVGSSARLAEATRGTLPVTDDRPIQEYAVRSLLEFGEAVPATVVNLAEVATWCPACFAGTDPIPLVAKLRPYLALLDLAYGAPPEASVRVRQRQSHEARTILGSRYLGTIVPESGAAHTIVGLALAEQGALDEAIVEFERALALDPTGAVHWHLGAALAARGDRARALGHLRRAVELDPTNGRARYDLATLLITEGRLDEAGDQLRRAVAVLPDFAEGHERLGVVLAAQGRADEAADAFRRALALQPDLSTARRGLAALVAQKRRP